MKIVVLAGGLSPERNVSLSSGCKVCAALAKRAGRDWNPCPLRAPDRASSGQQSTVMLSVPWASNSSM